MNPDERSPAQRRTWSVSALARELGRDRRTITKELEHVTPAELTPRGARYWLADVVAALGQGHRGGAERSAGGLGDEGLRMLRLEGGGPLVTVGAGVIGDLLGRESEEIEELLGWGMPYFADAPDGSGRCFAVAHVIRWLALMAARVGCEVERLPLELAGLRGGAPRRRLSGFRPLRTLGGEER